MPQMVIETMGMDEFGESFFSDRTWPLRMGSSKTEWEAGRKNNDQIDGKATECDTFEIQGENILSKWMC